MRKSLIIAILAGFCLVILGIFSSLILQLVGFILTVYGTIQAYLDSREQKKRDLQIINIQKETKEYVSQLQKKIDDEFTYKKILNRIRKSLRGTLSTKDIINELDSPLYALIIHKWGEPSGEKIIRNRLYSLGFKDLGQGVKILPPTKMPKNLRTREDIQKWLKQNVLKDLPEHYKYSIIYATLIDLRKVYAEKSAPKEWAHRFRGQTIFDRLSWGELFPPEFIRKTIYKKLKVSIEELINEHFPLIFLLSRFLGDEDLEKVSRERKAIIEEIKKTFNLNKLLLVDFAEMSSHELSKALGKYGVKNSGVIAIKMIEEATVWKQFLS